VRSGTTRVQHRTMAEFTSARSGIDSPVKPMDRSFLSAIGMSA
jgi:hypothetical protein